MRDIEHRSLVVCTANNMYGFTKDEAYRVVAMWYSEGESYIIKGHMFYDVEDDNGNIHTIEENSFKKYFKVI